jgi:hypothetical protein
MLVIARGIVGIGGAGMGFMVTIIFNGIRLLLLYHGLLVVPFAS